MTAARKLIADDLFAAGDDVRAELIDGEISPKAMSNEGHGDAALALASWVRRRFHRDHGQRWPGGWRIVSEIHVGYTKHDVYCHDIAGWRRDRMDVRPTALITLPPDWVCEVLSRGHEKRDRVEKPAVLHRAGVPHYWLVDHEEQILFMHRYTIDGYVTHTATATDVIHAPPFDGVELRVAILFGADDEE